MSQSTSTARREFIKFLAASPYVAALGGVAAFFEQIGLAQSMQETSDVITSPAGAFDVFDFEEAAHRKVLQGHWAYMASGVDDDATLRANREGFKHVELRPRRLRDATKVDMRVDLFGTTYNSPIFLCPTGGEKSFFADGELSVARAAKARGTLQFLSTATSTPVEEVCKNEASRSGISFTQRPPGMRMRKFCGAWKPPDAPSSLSPWITLRAATVKPTCALAARICISASTATKLPRDRQSKNGRCTTAST